MKTILDKIDLKYIDCATGLCEHISHKMNTSIWLVVAVALVIGFTKYRHAIITTRD